VKKYRLHAVLIFTLIASRLIYSYFIPVDVRGDAGSYLSAAMNLAEKGYLGTGNGPDFSRPPLYSILLAGFTKLGFPFGYWTFVILNCLFDAISMLFLIAIARRVVPASLHLGLFIAAITPMWFVHVNSPITEPISILMFLGFLERWTREKRGARDEIIGGLYLGGLTLCRAMFLWFPVAIVLFELVHRKAPKGAKLEGLRRIGSFVAAGLALPLLWGLRNFFVTGIFAMTQDSFTAIMMAWYGAKLPLLDWRMEEHVKWINEHKWSQVLYGRVGSEELQRVSELMKIELREFIRDEPLTYIANLFPKALRLWVNGWWNPFNYGYSPRYMGSTFIWSFAVPVLSLGLIGLFRHWDPSKLRPEGGSAISQWRAVRMQLAVVLYITALTLPFTVDARYSVIGYVGFCLWVGAGMMLLFQPSGK
jgi:hypothetical protein